MTGTCVLHIVPINSIRLPTVGNAPSLNTLARNPVIQCLRGRVPTPVFLDNPQSLTDPSFDPQINPPTPAHPGFEHELSLLTTVHGLVHGSERLPISYIIFFNTISCLYGCCCHLSNTLSNQFSVFVSLLMAGSFSLLPRNWWESG